MKHDPLSFGADARPISTAAALGAAPPAGAAARPRAAYGGYAGAGDAARREVADRVRRFQPMVRRQAWHIYGGGRSGIELDDLMQAGLVALTECAQRHDGVTEDGFAAYAKMRVRGAMVDMLRRATPLARPAADRRRQLREREATLSARLGRPPTDAELAAELGLTLNGLADMRAASQPVRVEPLDDLYSDSNPAFADDRPDSFALLADQEQRQELVSAITSLPERLQIVIQLYFVEELNLSEIAEALEVSVPRVHQLKAQALEKLRAMLGDSVTIL